jgi:WD40 repeat protein
LLFVGAQDASLHIYDASTGRLIHRILGPPQQQSNSWPDVVAVNPDGKTVAIAYPVGSNAVVSIYSISTWRRQFTLMTLPEVEISALAFSPDGTRLAIGAEDGIAGVWSVFTRQELVSYDGPTAAIDSIQFTPDGNSVLTASDDGIARLWRAIGVEQSLHTLPLAGGPQQIAFDGARLETVASAQPAVFSARVAAGQPVRRTKFPGVRQVILSPDGRLALGLGSSAAPLNDGYLAAQIGPLTVWDTRTGRVVRKVPSTAIPTVNLELPPMISWNDTSIAFDGGSTGFGGAQGGTIMSLTTGQTVPLLGGPVFETCGSTPGSFAFSRDGRRLAGAYFCGYAAVWDTRTGRLLRQVYQGGEVSAVDLSPDGSRLLVSSWDSRATIWSVAAGRRLVNLIGDTQGLEGAVFSPNGSLVATSSLDDTVRIWNAYTGQELRVLSFPDAQSPPVFNASGSQFAVAESDPPGTQDNVRVFDTCPACTNARALLGLAASHVTKQLTVLEQTVVNGA